MRRKSKFPPYLFKQTLTESDRQIILEIAKKLGIDVNGLSDAEILKKIQEKIGK
ncbi:MAG: hypothetical protein QXK13_06925 [Fervidicoccaceae archaeon]